METIVLKDRFTSRMSDEEFLWFCLENKDLRIERNSNLEIVIKSPVTSLSGSQSLEIARQLANWAIKDSTGISFDSSAGFTLSDRSVLSPDASWVSNEKWNSLSEEDKDRFAPICPDFVIEVRSKSDVLSDLQNKMIVWLKNGAQLAWLDKKIIGNKPVKGFELDLSLLRT